MALLAVHASTDSGNHTENVRHKSLILTKHESGEKKGAMLVASRESCRLREVSN